MRKNKQILVFALLFSFLCFPVKQAFASAGMTEVRLTVKQSFVVENPVKEMDFTGNYEFRALDQEAPMPENTKNPSACTTMIKLIKIPHNFRSFILSSPPYIQVHGLL